MIVIERAIAAYEARVITRRKQATCDRTRTKETTNVQAIITLEAVSRHAFRTDAIKSTAGYI